MKKLLVLLLATIAVGTGFADYARQTTTTVFDLNPFGLFGPQNAIFFHDNLTRAVFNDSSQSACSTWPNCSTVPMPDNLKSLVIDKTAYPDLYKFSGAINITGQVELPNVKVLGLNVGGPYYADQVENAHQSPLDHRYYWKGNNEDWENNLLINHFPISWNGQQPADFTATYTDMGYIIHLVQDSFVPAHSKVVWHGLGNSWLTAPYSDYPTTPKSTGQSDNFERFVTQMNWADAIVATQSQYWAAVDAPLPDPGTPNPSAEDPGMLNCYTNSTRYWLDYSQTSFGGVDRWGSYGVASIPISDGLYLCVAPNDSNATDFFPDDKSYLNYKNNPDLNLQNAFKIAQMHIYVAAQATAAELMRLSTKLPPLVFPDANFYLIDFSSGTNTLNIGISVQENRSSSVNLTVKELTTGRFLRATIKGVPQNLDGTSSTPLTLQSATDLTKLPYADDLQLSWDGTMSDGGALPVGTYTLQVSATDGDNNNSADVNPAPTILMTVTGAKPLTPSLPSNYGQFAYVTSYPNHSLTVVNLTTGKLVASIPITNPLLPAITPDGSEIYLIDDSSTLYAISASTNSVIASITIPESGQNNALAISPDGSRVYVSHGYTVAVVDTRSNMVIADVQTPSLNGSLVVTHDGKHVYTQTAMIDTSTFTASTGLRIGGDFDAGMALSPTTNVIYVAGCGSVQNEVCLINTDTDTLVTTLPSTAGVALGILGLSPDRSKLYVWNLHVLVIDTATGAIDGTFLNGGIGDDFAASADNSSFYVTTYAANSIEQISASTGAILSTIPLGSYAQHIAIASIGPTITSTNLPAAISGSSYNQSISFSDATSAILTVSSGSSLPNGFTLSPSGIISSTGAPPSSPGAYSFNITATQTSTGYFSQQQFTLVVEPPLVITNSTLPNAIATLPYSLVQLLATGGSGAYQWSVSAGSLPPGFTFTPSGILSSGPTPGDSTGSSTFTLRATDSNGAFVDKQFTLQIVPNIQIATVFLPNAVTGQAYSSGQLTTTGTSTPPIWSVVAGSLPSGFTLSPSGVLTSSGSPAVTTNAYSFIVQATDTASGAYAQQAFSLLVQTPQTITFGPIAQQTVGASLALTASASSGLAVTYSASPSTVCSVSGSTVSVSGPGTCSITASQVGNTTYAAAPQVTQTFTVGSSLTTQTITFGPIAQQTVGTPLTLTASASSGLPVSYVTSPSTVCSLNGSTASFSGPGTCSITASQAGNSTYAAATPVTQTFSVVTALTPQTITFGPITQQTVGTSVALTASASSGLPVSYAATPSTVCSLNGSTASFSGPGSCSITASQAGNTSYSAATPVTQTFTVVAALTPQTTTFGPITQQTVGTPLTVNASASSGLSVSYTASPSSICSVNGSTASFSGSGACSITASQAGNPTYSAAAPVTRTFTVVAALTPQTITFGPITQQTVGVPLTLTADASSSLPVSYAATPSTVCSINGSTASFSGPGICSITASQAGNTSYSAATPVTQTFSVVAARTPQTITFGPITQQTVGSPLTLTASASSGLPVTYVTSPSTICSLNGSTASFSGPGTCSITASQAGNSTYAAATPITQIFTVVAALTPQTITFGPITQQTVGTPLTLNASASSGLPVSYVTSPSTVCSLNGSTVSFSGPGTCSITASQSGNLTYSAASPITRTFTVVASLIPQTITFGPIPQQTVGTPLTLAASASSGLPVSYTASPSNVCAVNGSAANFIGAGSCSITASQAGNSTYAVATPVTQTFTTTASSAPPPYVGYLAFWGVTNSGVTISWSTDVLATTILAYGTTTTLGQFTPTQTALTASHGVVLTGLNPGTKYYFVAESTAANGATGYSTTYSFTTSGAAPPPAPMISNVMTTAITPSSVTITWTTDIASSSQVNYGTTTNYGFSSPLNSTLATNHSVTLTGLTSGTTYDFDVASANSSGVSTTSANYTFMTAAGSAGPGPMITNLQTTNISSTSVTVTWTTDQAATSTVNYGTSTAYGATAGNTTLKMTHSVALSGLTAGTTYDFDVVSSNSSGTPVSSANNTVTTISASATPPYVGYLAYWGVSNSGVYISWSTDVPANTVLAYGTTSALGQFTPTQTALTTSHGVVLTGLNPGTTYYFVAESTAGNGATGYSTTYNITTTGTAPAPAPTISNVIPTNITASSVTITWTTSVASSSQVTYGTTTSYSFSSPLNSTLATSQSVTLTGLTAATTYEFNVVSANSSGISTTSANYTFTTSASSGGPAPMITNVNTTNISSTSVTVTWITDQAATSTVNYGTTTGYGATAGSTTLTMSHSVTLTGLTVGTTYNFDVVSSNSSGTPATSANNNFTTTSASATPPYVGYLAYWGVTNSGVTISWSTDVIANTVLAYGTTTTLGQFTPTQTSMTASHGVVLTGLNPGTKYYFVAESTGANGATGYSTTYSFTTSGTAPTP